MQRLTLILSDLFLPEETGPARQTRGMVDLPNLAWLLRFATHGSTRMDWRQHLLTEASPLSGVEPVHLVARAHVPAPRLATCWFATPLHLEARLDHVVLHERGLLRIDADERRVLCEEFARHFGPELQLHDLGPRGLLLSGLVAEQASTADPATRLGADIEPALPSGAGAGSLKRLSAEIEMWLHGAQLNRERERARLPSISTLWLWGGGRVDGAAQPLARDAASRYAGDEPFLAALSRERTGVDPVPVPSQLSALGGEAAHVIVELTTVDKPAGEFARLDAAWFAAARVALNRGHLARVDVAADRRVFSTPRHAGVRFWRRRRHWSELLRR